MVKAHSSHLGTNELVATAIITAAQKSNMPDGVFSSLVGGSLGDRWGHKWVLFLGMIALAISNLLYGIQIPWLVILLWGVGSAGMGFTTVSGQGYLTMAASTGILGLASALSGLARESCDACS